LRVEVPFATGSGVGATLEDNELRVLVADLALLAMADFVIDERLRGCRYYATGQQAADRKIGSHDILGQRTGQIIPKHLQRWKLGEHIDAYRSSQLRSCSKLLPVGGPTCLKISPKHSLPACDRVLD
jgi:hypothetical protein